MRRMMMTMMIHRLLPRLLFVFSSILPRFPCPSLPFDRSAPRRKRQRSQKRMISQPPRSQIMQIKKNIEYRSDTVQAWPSRLTGDSKVNMQYVVKGGRRHRALCVSPSPHSLDTALCTRTCHHATIYPVLHCSENMLQWISHIFTCKSKTHHSCTVLSLSTHVCVKLSFSIRSNKRSKCKFLPDLRCTCLLTVFTFLNQFKGGHDEWELVLGVKKIGIPRSEKHNILHSNAECYIPWCPCLLPRSSWLCWSTRWLLQPLLVPLPTAPQPSSTSDARRAQSSANGA